MAKLPRVPKGVLPKAPRVPPPPQLKPFSPRPAQSQPGPPTLEDRSVPRTTAQRVWDERPKAADFRRLSPEEMKAPQHVARVQRWRQWPLMICGIAAFGMGLYAVQMYVSLTQEPEGVEVPEDLSDRFDSEAEGYDEKVDLAETMLRVSARRKEMARKARGHVLEVAVGTGRNIPYYPTKQCATVTLLDSSAPMLAVAKRKWKDTHPEYFSRVFFKQQSAIDPITPPYGAQDGYDTILQTMGLCSTPEPVKLLHSLEAATKEDGGQILLLEHGKSHYEWLNDILDKTAPNHALTHGCWWNKDIGKIVEESGLEVVDIKRYNFGTTWWVELKARKGMRKQLVERVEEEMGVGKAPTAQSRSWWSVWR
ncbi:S-adenosyl-L-methionine-dependent methyltransferase [Massarina eburnea CBS 473.64]|uniref:S-adenosyl-L-methionine-dependent methyltransferase n=1 Tax=Massarina eburnea CBS 473.64 TaxID=1395130 RepID=A0A6A6SCW8_9PLEO|nr:S-adenosyl-L-methionine-dependent methyltransferase [Massarina eburnea CBS 473.64]